MKPIEWNLSTDEKYWKEQSILHWFDHRRCEIELRAFREDQGCPPEDVVNEAKQQTIDMFGDEMPEAQIIQSIDTYIDSIIAANQAKREVIE
jgi:hypothetical protein